MVSARWRWLVLGSLAVLAGCSADGTKAPNASSSSSTTPATALGGARAFATPMSSKLDLARLVSNAHFAFRKDAQGAFVGGDANYAVSVDAKGVALTPYDVKQASAGPKRRERGAKGAGVTATRGSTLSLRTIEVRRDARVDAEPSNPSLASDGSLRIARGAVSELLANTAKGVEQSWRFDKAPAGKGDLVVRVNASGQAFGSADASGLSFKDHDGGVSVHYGAATWVDATGAKTPVDMAFKDGVIELRVAAAVLETSKFPAVLDPIAGSGGGTITPQENVTVSAGGGNYLLAWEDYQGGTPRVLTARVRASDNVILDTFGTAVTASTAAQYTPTSAFDGSRFLVTWQDFRSGSGTIFGSYVDAGTGAAGSEFQVGTAGGESWPNVGCGTAGNCVVGYGRLSGSADQIFVRSIVNGALGGETQLSNASRDQDGPVFASDGNGYFVAWEGLDDNGLSHISGAKLDMNGGVTVPTFGLTTADSGEQYWTTITQVGGNYLVAYTETPDEIDENVVAKKIDAASGAVTGGAIALASTTADEGIANLTTNGSEILLSFVQDNKIAEERFDGNLSAMDSGPSLVTSGVGGYYPTGASIGGDFFTTWTDWRAGTGLSQIFAARISAGGAILDTNGFHPDAQSCGPIAAAASPAGPQLAGTTVTVQASATCTAETSAEYQFLVDTGSGFRVAQDFGSSSTFSWDTTGLADGTYYIVSRVRHLSEQTWGDDQILTTYQISSNLGSCSAGGLTPSVASPEPAGTPVTFTASGSCSGSSEPEYQFYVQPPNGSFAMVQDWGSSRFAWDTTNLTVGTYAVMAKVRRIGASAAEDQTTTSYTIETATSGTCSNVDLTSDMASPQSSGATVTFTGNATCSASATPDYQFQVLDTNGVWSVAQDWSASSQFAWNTTNAPQGTYFVMVRARRHGETGVFELTTGTQGGMPYAITGTSTCTDVTAAANQDGPSAWTITGSAGCGSATAEYQYWLADATTGGMWTLVTDWTTSAQQAWDTSSIPQDRYVWMVRVRAGSSGSFQSQAAAVVDLTP